MVDHTPPRIRVSGIRNQGIYREQERVVNLYLEDNLCLEQAEVTFGGDTTSYDAETLRTSDNGIVLHFGKEEQWQNLRVRAIDAAGNETEENLNFLIWSENSSDRNRLWLLGILVALGIIVACKVSKKTTYTVCIERRWIRMEEMTDKELLQKNVEEFSRLQSYMKLCEKDSEVYQAMRVRYVELKVILTAPA